jgi:hypothetical protein
LERERPALPPSSSGGAAWILVQLGQQLAPVLLTVSEQREENLHCPELLWALEPHQRSVAESNRLGCGLFAECCFQGLRPHLEPDRRVASDCQVRAGAEAIHFDPDRFFGTFAKLDRQRKRFNRSDPRSVRAHSAVQSACQTVHLVDREGPKSLDLVACLAQLAHQRLIQLLSGRAWTPAREHRRVLHHVPRQQRVESHSQRRPRMRVLEVWPGYLQIVDPTMVRFQEDKGGECTGEARAQPLHDPEDIGADQLLALKRLCLVILARASNAARKPGCAPASQEKRIDGRVSIAYDAAEGVDQPRGRAVEGIVAVHEHVLAILDDQQGGAQVDPAGGPNSAAEPEGPSVPHLDYPIQAEASYIVGQPSPKQLRDQNGRARPQGPEGSRV